MPQNLHIVFCPSCEHGSHSGILKATALSRDQADFSESGQETETVLPGFAKANDPNLVSAPSSLLA